MPKTEDKQGKLLDGIVSELDDPRTMFENGGLFDQLKKKLVEKWIIT